MTAVGVDATRLSGRFALRPEPAVVLDSARRSLPEVVARVLGERVQQIDDLGAGRYRIHPTDGRAFEIVLRAADLSGVRTTRGHNVVAHTARMGRSGYRVRLSERLDPNAVPETLIHELREVLALRSGSLRQRLATRLRRDALARGTDPTSTAPLSGHDHGGLGQLDLHGHDAEALRGTGWPWVRTVFEAAALARHLGLDPANPATAARIDRLHSEGAISPATRDLFSLLGYQSSLTPAELLVVQMAHALAANPPQTGDSADLYARWGRAVADLADSLNHPQFAGELVNAFFGDMDPAHLSQFASRNTALVQRFQAKLPPGARPTGRLPASELRDMAAAYPTADESTRLSIRRQLAPTVDRYRSQRDHTAADRLLLDIPPDVRPFLDLLAPPDLSPADIQQITATHMPGALPTTASLQSADFARNLMNGIQPLNGLALRDALDRLAVEGERAIISLPRLPHLAGQVVRPDPALMNALASVDSALANRVWQEGIYVDLRGVVDLTPFAPAGFTPVTLGPVGAHMDPSTPGGRAAIVLDDQRRAEVTYVAAYTPSPQVSNVLATHRFHHVGDVRTMRPVPTELADLVAAMNPNPVVAPSTWVRVDPGTGNVRLVAHRPELVSPGSGSVSYGTPLDSASGRMPLWQGRPTREQFGQGGLGDCGTIATIRSVAERQPNALGQAIRANSDGTYTVRLSQTVVNGDVVTPTGSYIDVVVDGALPVRKGNNFAYGRPVNAAWGAVIERALASMDQTWDVQRQAEQHNTWYWGAVDDSQQNNTPAPDRFQAAPTGYSSVEGASMNRLAEMMSQLTGQPARMSQMDTSPNRETVMLQRLQQLIAMDSPIVVCTQPKKDYIGALQSKLPHGLHHNHAYEVVAVNSDGTVTLSNPWNNPKQNPNPLPIADFLSLMANQMVHLDIAPPAAPPAPPVAGPAPAPGPFTAGHDRTPGQESEPPAGETAPSSPSERAAPPRRYTPNLVTVNYYVLRMPDNSEAGVIILVSRDGEMTSVWQVTGGSFWQHSPGAVLPPEAPEAQPDPVDRTGAEATSFRVLRQPLPAEAWLKSLAG